MFHILYKAEDAFLGGPMKQLNKQMYKIYIIYINTDVYVYYMNDSIAMSNREISLFTLTCGSVII